MASRVASEGGDQNAPDLELKLQLAGARANGEEEEEEDDNDDGDDVQDEDIVQDDDDDLQDDDDVQEYDDDDDDDDGGDQAVYFPDLVLCAIFRHLSFGDLLSCSCVCRQWRDFLSSWPRWHSLPSGLDVHCHDDIPSLAFAAAHFPRTTHVSLNPSVPFYVSAICDGPLRDALTGKFSNLPLLLVDDILTHGSRLQTLNMSSMRLGQDSELAIEDVWSRVTIRDNRLTTLAFPLSYALTGNHLKYVFDKHPRLEHLSLSTATDDVTTDDSDHPFGVFNSLKSLRLDIDKLWPSAVMKLLSLRSCYQLESLAITKCFYLIDQEMFGPRMEKDAMTCLMQLTLMGSLVHLHLGIALTYVDVAVVLFNCCKLETLRIDYVDADRGSEGLSRSGVLGLALSAGDVPQRLASATFGLAPGEVSHGLGGLVQMLSLCASLTEVAFFPQSESGEVPIELAVSPTEFFTKLAPEPRGWSHLVSAFFHLPNRDEWRRLRTTLPSMPKLRTLYLLVDAELEEGEEEEGLALDELANLREDDDDDEDDSIRRIQTLHLRISNSRSLLFLERVLHYWRSIENLYVSIPYGELLMEEVDFYDFMEKTSPTSRLKEVKLHLPPLILEKRSQFSPTLKDRLRFVTTFALPVAQFGPMSFESLVALCPSVEVFTVGDGTEFFTFNDVQAYKMVSGLGLIDLSVVSGWKWLKRCLLVVDVDDHAIEYIPSVVENRPPAPYRDFAEAFVALKDSDLVPRLRNDWKVSLRHLQRIEVIASVYDFSTADKIFHPLIFATDCGLGRLHFMP